jgi:xanthine dehydrogenase YagS FAD-binding subunit
MEMFSYARAEEPGAAVKRVSAQDQAAFLAGGTTLIDLMKLEVQTPRELVDINGLTLTKIEEVAGGKLRVGALVRNSDMAYHELVRKRYPVLSEALLSGASPQLRNMATLGGNLLQRTRCTYFRDTAWACNKRKPGTGCSALDGYNRSHALLGTSDKCIATHPSDMCVALMALEAVIYTLGPQGERNIPIQDFYVAYGEDPVRENVLEHGELITAIELPAGEKYQRSHYLKVRDRASFEFALVSVAAMLEVADGKVQTARVALGGVAAKPWRAVEAEKVLIGAKPEEAVYVAAAKEALQGAKPRKDNGFKVELARRAIVRALTTVGDMK